MNFNYILKNLNKILNITNKSLPLLGQLKKPILKIGNVLSKQINTNQSHKQKEKENNNSLSFFK